jgi:SNF2 family DNA or RNA helicase
MKDRQANVQALQEGRLKGLGVSILAGGSGLTLTAAHNALFVDRSYVPAENLQAEDRMVRFGQLHPVLISTLVADHKLERRLNEILTIKLTTVSGVL